MNSRIVIVFIALTIAWLSLIFRSMQLQILPNQRLAELQKRQYKTLIELPARRGVIADRYGKELAVTIPAYSLFADPKEITDAKKFSKLMGAKLGMSSSFIYQKIKNKEKRFVWLKRRLKKEFTDQLLGLKLRGLGVVEESERVYPNESLMAHVLGFVGQEGQGLEGLELKYDAKLKGESKKIKIERDARGRPLLVDGRVFADVPAGFDLNLTIDHQLQYRLERELKTAVDEFAADSAVGIVLDAQTSEILAIGNWPTYDPNTPHLFPRENWRNRAVTDAFEPGSTLKSLIVAGGLREGTLKPNKKYFCENGEMKIGGRTLREADRKHVYGNITVSEILAHSSNIGTAKIALELGEEKVKKVLSDFGVGQKTGVGLPGESTGILLPSPWRPHLLANVSIGHGVTTTPLQIAAAYAAFASDGVLREPAIIKSALNQETGERIEYQPKEIRRVLSAEQASTMRLMLSGAVSHGGTGSAAQVPGFPVAGKTGTAQKNVAGQGYVKGQYISSFAGFIPSNDPKYVIYVAVDNPREKYYGAEVAAPLFSRLAGFAVRHGGLAPVLLSEKSVVKKRKPTSDEVVRENSIKKIREMAKILSASETNITPDFKGLTLREVYTRIRGTPFQVSVNGQGLVQSTEPAPGEPLPANKTIQVFLEHSSN